MVRDEMIPRVEVSSLQQLEHALLCLSFHGCATSFFMCHGFCSTTH